MTTTDRQINLQQQREGGVATVYPPAIDQTAWGFRGWVMSDWGATHSTVEAANAGLDQEFPMNEDGRFGFHVGAASRDLRLYADAEIGGLRV